MVELDLSVAGGLVFSALMLVPYIAWGVYTLRLRYRYHHEMSAAGETVTLFAVAVFFIIEMFLLRRCMGHMPLYYMFALLGLVVSGAALYGAMLVSVASRVLVDLLFPPEPSKTHEPRYAPAEALDRDGDYEGAIQEYITIARIFPKEPKTFLRIADLCVRTERHEEAAGWLERAIPLMSPPDQALAATNRLCEIYTRKLGRTRDALDLLNHYIERFPEGEFSDAARARRERLTRQLEQETVVLAPPPADQPTVLI